LIGLLLSALNPFKMILFWGLKKIPLLLEIPTLKDHLKKNMVKPALLLEVVLSLLVRQITVKS
jgi:hypothetical protein